MAYEYRMVQVPPTIATKAGKGEEDAAARYLQEVANREGEQGWEFQRVDTMNIHTPAGCMALGAKPETYAVYVMTFRRPRVGGS